MANGAGSENIEVLLFVLSFDSLRTGQSKPVLSEVDLTRMGVATGSSYQFTSERPSQRPQGVRRELQGGGGIGRALSNVFVERIRRSANPTA